MNPMEEIIRSAESAQLRALPAQTACQGVAGAFSHKACLEVFEQPDIQFYPSFEEVFAAVSSGQRRYGVIPIENTLAGSVTDNYDLMLQYGLYIVGSVKVKIEHALLALPNASLEGLRQVYSHEQAPCTTPFPALRCAASTCSSSSPDPSRTARLSFCSTGILTATLTMNGWCKRCISSRRTPSTFKSWATTRKRPFLLHLCRILEDCLSSEDICCLNSTTHLRQTVKYRIKCTGLVEKFAHLRYDSSVL